MKIHQPTELINDPEALGSIEYAIEHLKTNKSDVIVKHLGVKVVGAYYDIHSGEVEWL